MSAIRGGGGLFFAEDRLGPSVALVFGGAETFREGMGVELHEHSPPFAASVEAHDAIMDRSLADLLWYPAASAAPVDDVQRAAAVIAVGVGTAAVFRSEYNLSVTLYAGRGLGHVTAAAAAGVLSLEEVLRWIAVEGISLSNARRRIEERRAQAPALVAYATPEELVEALAGVDALVDMGPGDSEARRLRAAPAIAIPVGSWDSPIDRLYVRDRILRHTFGNPRYLVERTLGQIASTRTLASAPGDRTRVTNLARSLKALLRGENLPGDVVGADEDRVALIVRDAVSAWIGNALAKGYPPARIVETIVELEHETLFPIRRAWGIDAENLDLDKARQRQ